MHRSVVTGGAGFLGSSLCRRLLEDEHQVTCLDNFSSGRKRNVSELVGDPNFELVEGDVREGLDAAVDCTPDEIYHLASRASPVDFESYPVEIAMSNSLGTKHVLEFAERTDARVLLASTSEVYGDPEVHPQHESYNGNVNPRSPRAVYDESKRLGESLAASYHRNAGIDVRTVRIFNTYGPQMRPNDGRVVPTFVRQALSDEDLTVHGDGSQTRCFTYVDDLIRGFRTYMSDDDLAGAVVNIGNDEERTILELAEIILDVVDTDASIRYEPRPEDDPERRKPDLSRAHDHLDWRPRVSLREGLKKTVDHFETHE